MARRDAARCQGGTDDRKRGEKLAGWAAILAVPTMIAGIYGMNFERMPELHWSLGYPAVMVGMAAISGYVYHRFRRAGWL